MANSNAPFGFRPVRYRDGKDYTGAANAYNCPASDGTALGIGDPVIIAGSAAADGLATITRATAAGGAYISGVVVGFIFTDPMPATKHRLASTNMTVLVADDPDLLFEAQEDSAGGNLALTNVGQNIDMIAGSLSTITGLSGFMLDTSTAATTNTLQWRIEGFSSDPSNETPGTYGRYLVSCNLHQRRNLTGI